MATMMRLVVGAALSLVSVRALAQNFVVAQDGLLVSHSFTVPMSGEYGSSLVEPRDVQESFQASFGHAMQSGMGLSGVRVTSLSYTDHASSHRRMQSETVEIHYIVDCGQDGCLGEKTKLEQMTAKQMENIIKAIDQHAYQTGFGSSAVCGGQSKSECANSALSSLPAPGVVTIPIPITKAPTVTSKVTPSPTPKPTAKQSLCVSKNPCFVKSSCADDGKGGASCGDCPSGYSGDGKTCADVDDCAANKNTCGAKGKCTDAGTNKLTCKCSAGYGLENADAAIQKCILVSACGADEDDCVSGATCAHVKGTTKHTCTCPTGYGGDGKTGDGMKGCVDVNGCKDSPCDSLTSCSDIQAPGTGFTCGACPKGYAGDGYKGCTDVNDCANNPCSVGSGGRACTDVCTSGMGGSCSAGKQRYTCSCLSGFAAFGGSCRKTSVCHSDLGETCPDKSMTCSHDDKGGSFACNCGKGMTKNSDGKKCVDRNDCQKDSCDSLSQCSDVQAPETGFTCAACPKGYKESWSAGKQVCTDMDDCGADNGVSGKRGPCGKYGPKFTTSKCVNQPGVDYKCQCNTNYKSEYHCEDMSATQFEDFTKKMNFDLDTFKRQLCTDNEAGRGLGACNGGEDCSLAQITSNQVPDCKTMKSYGLCAQKQFAAVANGYCFSTCFGDSNGKTKCQGITFGCDVLVPAAGCKAALKDGLTIATPCQKSCQACGFACDAINNCAAGEDDCSKDATCNHAPGQARHACTCNTGFSGNGKECSDTNGCSTNPCSTLSQCSDVKAPGTGYQCGSCPSGYSGTGYSNNPCSDIDDCKTSAKCVSPDDSRQLTCVNKPGTSYTCDCGSDYYAGNGTCYLKNKCTLDPCDANADCNNDNSGGFSCKCKTGYVGDGINSCADVNGCEGNPCDKLTTCTDVAAAQDTSGKDYTCSACPSGYAGSGVQGCSDIDDCVGNPCGAAGKCSNDGAGTGRWKCECALGYKSVSDSDDITDKDAGFFDTNVGGKVPSGMQKNKNGQVDYGKSGKLMMPASPTGGSSFTCADAGVSNNWNCATAINKGYWFGRSYSPNGPSVALVCRKTCGWSGPTCSVVDSCTTSANKCDSNADCAHLVMHGGVSKGAAHSTDSYTCTCKAKRGFIGDGKTCTDKNACQQAGSVCGTQKFGDVASGKGCCSSVAGGDNVCADSTAGTSWSSDAQFSCQACPSGYTTGYTLKGQSCTDVADCSGNPCGKKSSGCTENGAGTGKYTCTCSTGYTQASGSDGKDTCILADECAADEDECVDLSSCLPNNSSQKVSHTCKCDEGYEGDGTKTGSGCSDINECTDSTCYGGGLFSSQQRIAACSDLPPSELPKKTTCASCPKGYTGNGVTCSDADDCASAPCGKANGATCKDVGLLRYKCTCPSGYKEDGSADDMKNTCTLQNACVAGEDDCVGGATCNHVGAGAHTCTCPTGMSGDGTSDGSGCTEINACDAGPCNKLAQCSDIKSPGTGFSCGKCPQGYAGNGVGEDGCKDIDGCANRPCPTLQGAGNRPACTDKAAPQLGFTCDSCPTGYDTDAVAQQSGVDMCMDTDGCKDKPCNKLSTCIDLKAPQTGFSCVACPTGYSGNAIGDNGCVDVDDCANSPCKNGGTCADAGANAYTCACPKGYSSLGNSQKPTCQHVNACASGEDDCVTGLAKGAAATCNHDDTSTANNPKHSCTCPKGFKGDGTKSGTGCADIDGCSPNQCATLSGAGTRPACTDKAAPELGYTCAPCPTGYDKSPQKAESGALVCQDTNACASTPCSSLAKCTDQDAPGTGYSCGGCPTGYSGDGYGKSGCVDTDGCAGTPCATLQRGGIAPKCTDVSAPGTGYQCAPCPTGYNKQPVDVDGSARPMCMDTDGCASAPCDKLTSCKDVFAPGTGFKCSACPSGYSGDGVKGCTDINDCANAPCGQQQQSCTDTGANSYSCTCTVGYQSLGDAQKPTCQHTDACKSGEDDCVKNLASGASATCNHDSNSKPNNPKHTCTCPKGYKGDGRKGGSGCADMNGCSPNQCASLEGTSTRLKCTDQAAPKTSYDCAACPTGYDSKPVVNQKTKASECKDSDGCKNSPCSDLVSCTDEKAPKTGFACGNCPAGYVGNGISKRGCSINYKDDCANSPCGQKLGMSCTDEGLLKYSCSCPPGYESSGSPLTCNLVNACRADEDDCVSGLKSGTVKCNHVGAGQHTCTCPAGYAGDGRKGGTGCVDVDGCAGSKKCPALPSGGAGTAPKCTDEAAPKTGFTCSACPTGYNTVAKTLSGGTKECVDTNACAGNPCDSNTDCTDLKAPSTSYTCSKCPSGFVSSSGDGKTKCTDVDDCANNACGKGTSKCTDAGQNKRTCDCTGGYASRGDSKLPTCQLVNKCSAGEDDCVTGLAQGLRAKCNHIGGSSSTKHSCTCPSGYEGDGKSGGTGCSDINACAGSPCAKLSGAGTAPKCTDKKAPANGYTCEKCPTGYNPQPEKQSNGGLLCIDPDGCANSPCHPLAGCDDAKAPYVGYQCGKCPAGYKGDGVSSNGCAIDYSDDCANDPCGTKSGVSCKDQGILTYSCTCPTGYTSLPVNSKKPACLHMDACKSGENDCVTGLAGPTKSATCVHDPSSPKNKPRHTCMCPKGFSGNGRDKKVKGGNGCTDVDGCKKKKCPMLPSGGKGTAPKCIDDAPPSWGAKCTACPTGYDTNAKKVSYGTGLVCVDTNKCKPSNICRTKLGGTVYYPGGSAVQCVDAKAPALSYTCTACTTGFKHTDYVYFSTGVGCAGNGYSDLADLAECTKAYAEMRISRTTSKTAIDDKQDKVTYDPKGCYFEGNVLKFNVKKSNTGRCTTYDKCLCKADPQKFPQVRRCIDIDDCATSINKCGKTKDGTAHGCVDTDSKTPAKYQCKCQPGYTSAGSNKNQPTCQLINSCSADEDDCVTLSGAHYTLLSNGQTCESQGYTGLKTVKDCAAAATALNTADKTVTDDKQDKKGYDPKGCYYEGNSLKFNVKMTNTGVCTRYDQCLCAYKRKATCNHKQGSTSGEHTCTCPKGYTGSGKVGCTDRNACKPNPCPTLSGAGTAPTCTDAVAPYTGFTCSPCPTGYDATPVKNVCQDTNGCANKPCSALSSCADAKAPATGFTCAACPAGYKGNGILKGAGSKESSCTSTITSQKTYCGTFDNDKQKCQSANKGSRCQFVAAKYTGEGCTDKDDCASNPCGRASNGALHKCKDAGTLAWTCTCNAGYAALGKDSSRLTCKHVNGCKSSQNDCVSGATCNGDANAPAGHTCSCQSGMKGDGKKAGTGCTEIDGCANNPCAVLQDGKKNPSYAKCTDKKSPQTGYTCAACPEGYNSQVETLKGKLTCTDKNYCLKGSCDPQQSCSDDQAPQTTFQCSKCNKGYKGVSFSAMTTGRCDTTTGYTKITTAAQCAEAATALKGSYTWLTDLTVSADNQASVGYDPIGCYYEGTNLKFNSRAGKVGTNTGRCTTYDKCLCASTRERCVDVDDCATSPCGKNVKTCTDQGKGTGKYTCSCQDGYVSAGSPPSCQLLDACKADEDDCAYVAASSQYKAVYAFSPMGGCVGAGYKDVDSIAACSAAAKYAKTTLKMTWISDLTASNDNQNGVTYDPKGCYYEGGSLKFNLQKSNKGRCTTYDRCLCLTVPVKVKCNHLSSSKVNSTRHTCTCPTGYVGNGIKTSTQTWDGKKGEGCTDFDACANNDCPTLDGTSTKVKCTDLKAPSLKFTCAACPTGYDQKVVTTSAGAKICKDFDGCANKPCSKLVSCADVKAPGTGFRCGACPTGYEGNGISQSGCSDIDDCKKKPCGTATNIGCKDTGIGSYKCTCAAGYQALPVGSTQASCQLVNKCAADEDDCVDNLAGPTKSAKCQHISGTKGGHTCMCPAGYEGDGKKGYKGCTNINGCASNNCPTMASGAVGTAPKCVDQQPPYTGYTCTPCPAGFDKEPKVLSNGKKQCEDTDGCAGKTAKCSALSKCRDTVAPKTGFTCNDCPSGYKDELPTGVSYALKASGTSCAAMGYVDVTSLTECSTAGTQLKLSDKTASNDNQNGVGYDPKGCYFESRSLKFNVKMTNRGRCSNSDKCLCKSYAGRVCLDIDDCADSPCGTKLGTKCTDKGANLYQCTCPSGYSSVTGKNGKPTCAIQNECTAEEDDCINLDKYVKWTYAKKTTGVCDDYVESIQDCSDAGKFLKFRDTTATDDRQNGVGYDPKGCYFEGGSLKFNNRKTNKGKCTTYDQCLCKLSKKAKCNHIAGDANGKKPDHTCTCPTGMVGDGKDSAKVKGATGCADFDACKAKPCASVNNGKGPQVACKDLKAPSMDRQCSGCPSGYETKPRVVNGKQVCFKYDACATQKCAVGAVCSDLAPPSMARKCGSCAAGKYGTGYPAQCRGNKKNGDASFCSNTCKCGNGEGDCDSDTQCNTGLTCKSFETEKALVNKGGSGCTNSKKCGACEGDCDRDSHCKTGYMCFQRNDKTKVPTCKLGGRGDKNAYDFCVKKMTTTTTDKCVHVTVRHVDYVHVTKNTCTGTSSYITSAADCAKAAQQLKTGGATWIRDLTVSNDNQQGVGYDPKGCYYEGGSLKFNMKGKSSNTNKGRCSTYDNCLCKKQPYKDPSTYSKPAGCTDINDCAKTPCSPSGTTLAGAVCTDTGASSYKCTCPAGYSSVGQKNAPKCSHTDACKSGEDDCVTGAKCNHNSKSPAGKPTHTCTCPSGKTGDGRTGGTGCKDIDGCKPNPCATLPSGGYGSAPKCTDNKSPRTGASCATCPPGYNANPTKPRSGRPVCVDKNDCSAGPCGPGGTKCGEGRAGTGQYKCTCGTKFVASNNQLGKQYCYVDPKIPADILKANGDSNPSCGSSFTEAVLVDALIKLCPGCGIKKFVSLEKTVKVSFEKTMEGFVAQGTSCNAKPAQLSQACSKYYKPSTRSTTTSSKWRRRNKRTSSGGTGPDKASVGKYFVYLEASGSSSNRRIDSSIVYPDFSKVKASTVAYKSVSFDYHMYGSRFTGELLVESTMDRGITWKLVKSFGKINKGNKWLKSGVLKLNGTAGATGFRIRGKDVMYYRTDMAVDNIVIQQG